MTQTILITGANNGIGLALTRSLLKLTSQRTAVLLHGVLWGLTHAPLIYFGFKYGSNYRGAPITGMLMMVLVCVVLGTWLAYVTIQAESILPAVIFHGQAI